LALEKSNNWESILVGQKPGTIVKRKSQMSMDVPPTMFGIGQIILGNHPILGADSKFHKKRGKFYRKHQETLLSGSFKAGISRKHQAPGPSSSGSRPLHSGEWASCQWG